MAIVRYRDGNGNVVPLRVIQGEDGKQMFVRFSAFADGTNMSEVWDASRNYMGIAFGENAPTDKSGYQWIYITSSEALDEAVADLREEIATHTITADRVTDLAKFLEDNQTAKIARGTYAGIGTGSLTLNFGFVPKIIYIYYSGIGQTSQLPKYEEWKYVVGIDYCTYTRAAYISGQPNNPDTEINPYIGKGATANENGSVTISTFLQGYDTYEYLALG